MLKTNEKRIANIKAKLKLHTGKLTASYSLQRQLQSEKYQIEAEKKYLTLNFSEIHAKEIKCFIFDLFFLNLFVRCSICDLIQLLSFQKLKCFLHAFSLFSS